MTSPTVAGMPINNVQRNPQSSILAAPRPEPSAYCRDRFGAGCRQNTGLGVTLATSLSAYIQAVILYYILKRSGKIRPEPGWPKFILQLIAASALMAAVLSNWVAEPEIWRQWDVLDRGIG